MQFAMGRGWDATGHAFQRDRSFAAFGRNLAFSEEPTDDGVVYNGHKVTLHEVPNGNIQKKVILRRGIRPRRSLACRHSCHGDSDPAAPTSRSNRMNGPCD
jgi:hypothetical protein